MSLGDKSIVKRLRQYFIAGIFALIPVGLTVLSVAWLVHAVDRIFDFPIPGLGLLVTIGLVVLLGMIVSSVLGRHVFELFEEALFHVPGVRAVYKTVKALTNAFSPNSQTSFRHVVLVEYPHPGALSLGFVTSQMNYSENGRAAERWAAVYVPTNHLYIGNTILVPESKIRATPLSVPEAVQIILAGGASLPVQFDAKMGSHFEAQNKSISQSGPAV